MPLRGFAVTTLPFVYIIQVLYKQKGRGTVMGVAVRKSADLSCWFAFGSLSLYSKVKDASAVPDGRKLTHTLTQVDRGGHRFTEANGGICFIFQGAESTEDRRKACNFITDRSYDPESPLKPPAHRCFCRRSDLFCSGMLKLQKSGRFHRARFLL